MLHHPPRPFNDPSATGLPPPRGRGTTSNVLGVVGAIVGGYLWELIFSNHGIAWIGSVIAAVVILWAYERFVSSRKAKPAAR